MCDYYYFHLFLFISLSLIQIVQLMPNLRLGFLSRGGKTNNKVKYSSMVKFPQFDNLETEDLICLDTPKRDVNLINFTFAYNDFYGKMKPSSKGERLKIIISRANVINDTYKFLNKYKNNPSALLKRVIRIKFKNEIGEDNKGLTKEWMSLFSAEVFNPNYGLFEYSDEKTSTVHISPLSRERHRDHLLYFELIGILTGLAVRKGNFLEVFFSVPFLKTMLHRPISLQDVEHTDRQLYTTLMWIYSTDPGSGNLKFTAPESNKSNEVFRLIKNGEEKSVDEENKKTFLRLLINYTYIRRVQKQMSVFLKGFRSLVPLEMIQQFTADELQLIIGGENKINLKFWQEHTKHEDCAWSNEAEQLLTWFWEIMEEFDDKQRAKLLMFVTGTTRFCTNGRRIFNFRIQCTYLRASMPTENILPSAHTCTNTLEFPLYKSKKRLVKNLNKLLSFGLKYEEK